MMTEVFWGGSLEDTLSHALSACKKDLAYVVAFSLAVSFLVLTLPIYILQLFDRVLSSASLVALFVVAFGLITAQTVIEHVRTESKELTVEALVKPEDIYVAADRLQLPSKNQPTGSLVKVRLNKKEVALLDNIQLYPEMPTEVFILLEERTLWDYFIAPLVSSYYRAFRES